MAAPGPVMLGLDRDAMAGQVGVPAVKLGPVAGSEAEMARDRCAVARDRVRGVMCGGDWVEDQKHPRAAA